MGIEVPENFEHIISAIKHTVTSSWFFFSTHMQWCTDKHIPSLHVAICQLCYKSWQSWYLIKHELRLIFQETAIFFKKKALDLDHSCRNSLLYLSKRSGNIKVWPATWVFWRGKEWRLHVWNDTIKLWRKNGLQNAKASRWYSVSF